MKSNRLFAAALAAVAFAGCVKENQPAGQIIPGKDNPAGEVVTLDFTASMEAESKTTLGQMEGSSVPVIWESTDKLAMFVGERSYSDIAVTVDADNSKKAHFTAQIEAPAQGDRMIAFYPSQGAAAVEDGVAIVFSQVLRRPFTNTVSIFNSFKRAVIAFPPP